LTRRSIRFRLTAWYAAILAVTLAVAGLGVWLAIRNSIHETVDKDLRARLQAMREFLRRELAEGEGSGAVDELIEDSALSPVGMRFRIAKADGEWLYQAPGTERWNTPPRAADLPDSGRAETIMVNGKPIRVLAASAPLGVVQIGIPINEFTEMLSEFTWTALVASPFLLLLASAGGYWMSRRALAPVERIAQTAEKIQAQNLSERLPVGGASDELDHLSGTLNGMLARLEESFRRITQFTADASHELRTPVAIIRTTAEVTRRKRRTEQEYIEALDRILKESELTTGLIEDLMLLARADAQAETMLREPVALAELVRDTSADMRALAETAGVTLRVDELDECSIAGDARAMRRLLLILLENAIKYSKPGGEVRVALRIDEKQAVLEVRDNGIGIGPGDLPHIFERFYRASKDRSRKLGGVGLGLSIAQWIARQHGGEIQVQSVLGHGSVFRVVFTSFSEALLTINPAG
jgi:heavy metal sensor kinase